MNKLYFLIALLGIFSADAFAKDFATRKTASSQGEQLLQSMLGKYKGKGCFAEVFEVGDDYRFSISSGSREVLGKFDRNQVLVAVDQNGKDPEINNKEEGEVYSARLQISGGRLHSLELSHKSMLVFGASATCSGLR